jgi:hypothetical protein
MSSEQSDETGTRCGGGGDATHAFLRLVARGVVRRLIQGAGRQNVESSDTAAAARPFVQDDVIAGRVTVSADPDVDGIKTPEGF